MSGSPRATVHASSKAAVLDLIRAAGTISRVGLINATGLTGGTISTVVRNLIDEGLVVEIGLAESTGGKRRVLLQLEHSARYAVGVHLDHTNVTYVLVNLGGSVVARISRSSAGIEDPSLVVSRITRAADSLIESVGVDRDRVLGLGLVSPGPLAPTADMRLTPPAMRRWEDFAFDRALEKSTGLPVILDNDATAAALGEHWSGSVGATSTVAALYMGTGIGAGILLNGIPYRGPSGNAGEIGHTCLAIDGPDCWCGAKGCLEAVAGPAAVVAQARADRGLARAAGLTSKARAPVATDFAAISRAARRGDARASALLERSARYIAVAARGLANVVDLEVLVLTGNSFAIAGSAYLPVVRAEMERAFFARSAHPVEVRLSNTAATAPAVGAAAIVLQSELAPLRERVALPENLAAAEPPVLRPSSA
ncbi:ROK family protein [Kibdelosporangium persicum]|uniref:N-acetylglucosamine repressor n=1 Tax=Kibdelosporangium persicum TaxID=2698649 RepID=A0ABX2F6W2_9PSEU|nr:ROK family protein [Kibdelosporangium persicum]NRN66933.1 N-acetylglucosamine repressor [Kibdelosporangium persicum]